MNTILWAVQIILAIKLWTVTFNHGLRPDPAKMRRGRERFGALTRPLLAAISLLALLTGLGLVLPFASGFLPLTASVTAGMTLIATGFHLRCREEPKVWVSLILFALAVFVFFFAV